MYQATIDEHWVRQALESFDPAKISYVDAASEGWGPVVRPAAAPA